jgi:hypothetical protein
VPYFAPGPAAPAIPLAAIRNDRTDSLSPAGVTGLDDPSVDEKLFRLSLTNGLPCSGAAPAGVSFWTRAVADEGAVDEEDVAFFFRSESPRVKEDVDAELPLRGREDDAPSSSSGVGVVERDEVRECEPERMEVVLRRRFSGALAPVLCLCWPWAWPWL